MRVGKPVALGVIVTIMTGAFGDTLVGTVVVVATARAARALAAFVGREAVVVALAVWMVSTIVVAAAKSASRGSDAVWALLVAAAAAGVWLV